LTLYQCPHGTAGPTQKVSDGSQPPMTFDLSLSESAGSRSLDRLVRSSLYLDAASAYDNEAIILHSHSTEARNRGVLHGAGH
jgi:hypothetical protein